MSNRVRCIICPNPFHSKLLPVFCTLKTGEVGGGYKTSDIRWGRPPRISGFGDGAAKMLSVARSLLSSWSLHLPLEEPDVIRVGELTSLVAVLSSGLAFSIASCTATSTKVASKLLSKAQLTTKREYQSVMATSSIHPREAEWR